MSTQIQRVAISQAGHRVIVYDTPMDTRILELAVPVVIVQNFVVVGMTLHVRTLERLQAPAALIPNAYDWALIFIMFWINNIFVWDKMTDKIKPMAILRIISYSMIIH